MKGNRMKWGLTALLLLAGCGRGGDEAATMEAPLDGVSLGKPAHDLRAADLSFAAHDPRVISTTMYTTEGTVKDVLDWVNGRLSGCRVEHMDTGPVSSAGDFYFYASAVYPDGRRTRTYQFVAGFERPIDGSARDMLRMIPTQIFTECRNDYAPTGSASYHDGDRHLEQLIPALNDRLEGCSLRKAGTVGEPDTDGNFRFYLEAVYPSGTVDRKVHFETNSKNVITADVEDFLQLIPSQAFKQCRHKTGPGPGPGPDPEALRRHVNSAIYFANDKLEKCSLYMDGDIGGLDANGAADFYVNARYPDGTNDVKQKFRASTKIEVQQVVQDIVSKIPGQIFTKCKLKGSDPGPGPDVEALRRHVNSAVYFANDKLEQCTLYMDGDVGTLDANGAADFYVNARYPDGTGDVKQKFRTSTRVDVQQVVQDIVSKIPAQMFNRCKLKGGGPGPGPNPDKDQLRRNVSSIVYFVNDKLQKCTVYQEGDIGDIGADGYADFYLNARYDDGSADQKRKFRASNAVSVESQVAELMGMIPTQVFNKCQKKGTDPGPGPGPGPGPNPDAVRPWVASVLAQVNEKLANCILAISGRLGPIDDHGDFFFYLTAYKQEDGVFLDPARFQGNVYQSRDATAGVLLRLIPAVEFKECRQK